MSKGKRKAMLLRLPAKQFDAVTEFSRLGGITRNQFVADLVGEALPQLEKIVKALKEAKRDAGAPALRAVSVAMNDALQRVHSEAAQLNFELGLRAASKRPTKG